MTDLSDCIPGQHFDIPIYSGRQAWHQSTYERSPERGMIYVQTSGGRVLPKYESGLKAAIDSLKPKKGHLWRYGHYLWSAEVCTDVVMYRTYEAYLICMLGSKLSKASKPEEWKLRTCRVIKPALQEARQLKPPDMSGTKKKKYSNDEKETIVTGKPSIDQYHRSAKEHWDWVNNILDEWERLALIPVCEWINKKQDLVGDIAQGND